MKLTEKSIAKLHLPAGVDERLFSDDTLSGLSLRLRRGANGIAKSWVYRYTIAGVPRKLTLDFAGHDLAAARKCAGDLQARIRLGHDPEQERAQTRANIGQTVGAVLQTYLSQKKLTLRPRSYTETERHLLVDYAPLHRLPLRRVSTADITTRNVAIATTKGRTTATNSLRAFSAFLAWAMRQGLIDRNLCMGVERFEVGERDRVLSADEVKAIWDATAGPGDFSAITRMLLLTGCRADEIAGLQFDEIRFDRLELPAERTKTGAPLSLPLTPTMRTILDSQERSNSKYVFGRLDGSQFSGWSGSKKALNARIAATGFVMKGWRTHDLRRTLSTGMGELEISSDTIDRIINHAMPKVRKIYNHAKLERAKREALMLWDAHVRAIAEGRITGDRIVPVNSTVVELRRTSAED
jgi:integrase